MSKLLGLSIWISPLILGVFYFSRFDSLTDAVLFITIILSLVRISIPVNLELILLFLAGVCFVDLFGQMEYLWRFGVNIDVDSFKKASWLFNDSNYSAYFLFYIFLFTEKIKLRLLSGAMIFLTGSLAICASILIYMFFCQKNRSKIFWSLLILIVFLITEYWVDLWPFVMNKFASKFFIFDFEFNYFMNSSFFQVLVGDGINSEVAMQNFYPLRHTLLGYFNEVGLLGLFLLVHSYLKTIPTKFVDLKSIVLFANALISFIPISFLLPMTFIVRKKHCKF